MGTTRPERAARPGRVQQVQPAANGGGPTSPATSSAPSTSDPPQPTTTWRAAALWHRRLPALPLLLATTGNSIRDREARAYSPEDGRALRVPMPRFALGSHWQLLGSHDGGWIIPARKVDSEILIVNPFSGAQLRLPLPVTDGSTDSRKIIFSDDPTSSGCIAAAIIGDCAVGLCRIDCPELGWMARELADYPDGHDDDDLDDILVYYLPLH